MSKRASSTDSNANKERKPNSHPSQTALVKRCVEALDQEQALILASETGTGKTGMSATIAKKVHKKLFGQGDRVLYALITTDAAQAKKLGPMFGSMYANGFNFGNAGGVRKMLQKEGSAHITISARFFKENLLNVEDKELSDYEDRFLSPIAPTHVYLFLDEVESYVKEYSTQLKKMRKTSSVPVTFIGISATPGNYVTPYLNIFGKDPVCLAFTDEEQAAWDKEKKQPDPPKSWVTKKMKGSPGEVYKNALEKLQTLIVGDKLVTTLGKGGQAPPISSWQAKQNILGTIIAELAAGGGDGGLVFQSLDETQPMKVVGGTTKPCYESILVAHWADQGAVRHNALLTELRDESTGKVIEGVTDHSVHNLTSSLIAVRTSKFGAFEEAFKNQTTGVTLGFIKPVNAKSTNDFSKNVTGIIAIGQWPKDKLTQLRGRIGRMCDMEDGDIIPGGFKLVLIVFEWADLVTNAWSRSASLRNLKPYPKGFHDLLTKAKAKYPEVASRIEDRVGTLLKMDKEKLLGVSTLAMDYLAALASKTEYATAIAKYKEVRKDASFDAHESTQAEEVEPGKGEEVDEGGEEGDGEEGGEPGEKQADGEDANGDDAMSDNALFGSDDN